MGIHPVPRRSLAGTTFFLILRSIEFLVAVAEVFLLVGLLNTQSVGIAEAVPAPVALGAERHAATVVFGECLHAGGIGGDGKVAVSDAERCEGVHTGHNGVVSCHEGLAVNTLCRRQADCQTEQNYEEIYFIEH